MENQILINHSPQFNLLSVMINGKPIVLSEQQEQLVLAKLEEIKQIVGE